MNLLASIVLFQEVLPVKKKKKKRLNTINTDTDEEEIVAFSIHLQNKF